MAKTKFTGTSDKFRSAHKNKSVREVIDYFSDPHAYSGMEDIISLLEDISEFSFANSDTASKAEKEKLIKLYNTIRDSKKQNKKVIETISMNSADIKKAIKNELGSPAPQKLPPKVPIKPTGTKYSQGSGGRKPTVNQISQISAISKIIDKVSSAGSEIKPVKASRKSSTKRESNSSNRVVRTKEQIHEEKMIKVQNERHKLQNQSLKIKNESDRIQADLLRLDFHKKQFDEEIRHRLEKEYTERVRLDARGFEAKNKEKEIEQKGKHTVSAEKIAKSRISLARQKTKRQYDFMESDVGVAYYADINKTARNKQSGMNKRAKMSLQKAELALTNTRARNLIKEKQLEDRRMRDILRENARKAKERSSKLGARNRAIFEGIRESSPSLAYAYLGATKLMQNRFATQRPQGVGGGGDSAFMERAIGGAYTTAGLAGLGGGVYATKKLGLVGKSLAYGKQAISAFRGMGGASVNPSSAKYVTGLASGGSAAKIASGAAVPMSQKIGQALSAGRGANKLLGKAPLIGGAITGALEYNDSGSAGRAVAVGASSMAGAAAGAAIGAAAGSFIPGAGTVVGGLLGGIIGGTLGESGMKALTQKFLGKTQQQIDRESSQPKSSVFGNSSTIVSGVQKVRPSHFGKQLDIAPMIGAPNKQNTNVASVGDSSFFGKTYNSAYKHAVNAGAPNPDVLAHLAATQASLESNYGKSAPNNNLFGIKGSGSNQKTKEFINGQMRTVTQGFRGYESSDESINHFIRMMTKSKRYRSVANASTIDEAIIAQGKTGYATDPNYSRKLQNVKNRNSSRLAMVQSELDAKNIASSSAPAPVSVVNGGSSNVSNVQNTTVINQQDTDPTIRQHQYATLRTGVVL